MKPKLKVVSLLPDTKKKFEDLCADLTKVGFEIKEKYQVVDTIFGSCTKEVEETIMSWPDTIIVDQDKKKTKKSS